MRFCPSCSLALIEQRQAILDEKGIKEFLLLTGCETAHLDYTWSELRRTHSEGSDDRASKYTAVAFVLTERT